MGREAPGVSVPSLSRLVEQRRGCVSVSRGGPQDGEVAAHRRDPPTLHRGEQPARPRMDVGMSNTIWVICPDYGCEGLRAPVQAFLDEATAQAAMTLLSHGNDSFKLCAVEVWGPCPSTENSGSSRPWMMPSR